MLKVNLMDNSRPMNIVLAMVTDSFRSMARLTLDLLQLLDPIGPQPDQDNLEPVATVNWSPGGSSLRKLLGYDVYSSGV
jgi:hypothetical protein